MALGLTLIGLVMSAVVTCVGELWIAQGNLQDAANNAIVAMETANAPSATTLVDLVEADSGFQDVGVTSFSDASGHIQATVEAPCTLWFWMPWMGPPPFQVVAVT